MTAGQRGRQRENMTAGQREGDQLVPVVPLSHCLVVDSQLLLSLPLVLALRLDGLLALLGFLVLDVEDVAVRAHLHDDGRALLALLVERCVAGGAGADSLNAKKLFPDWEIKPKQKLPSGG